MRIDTQTRHAVKHTLHCLLGCGIGEVLGMLIAASLGWDRIGRLALAIILAFFFGYLLTYRGVHRQATTVKQAIKTTLATDTASIVSMEIVDNTVEFIIPNALMVMPNSPRFWWGLGVSLLIAFIVTVPVNRMMMSKAASHHMH